jgi:hypothetical protein
MFRYTTDVIFDGGMNPIPCTQGNTFPIYIEGVQIWGLMLLANIVYLFFN